MLKDAKFVPTASLSERTTDAESGGVSARKGDRKHLAQSDGLHLVNANRTTTSTGPTLCRSDANVEHYDCE